METRNTAVLYEQKKTVACKKFSGMVSFQETWEGVLQKINLSQQGQQ